MRFSEGVSVAGLPQCTAGLGSTLVFPVNESNMDLDRTHGADDLSGFVRVSHEQQTKPPAEEGQEETQVTVAKVHTADHTGSSWSEICSGEMNVISAFIIEGVATNAAPEAAGAAAAEDASRTPTPVDPSMISEVAAGYAGVAITEGLHVTRQLFAFVEQSGEEPLTTFSAVRQLDLLAETPEWSEVQLIEGDAPTIRQGCALTAFKDGTDRAWLFGGEDTSGHTVEDGSADALCGFYNDAWILTLGAEMKWDKVVEFAVESTPFGLEHAKLGETPLAEVEGADRLADLPSSGPYPRSWCCGVCAPGTGKLLVTGGRFYSRAAAEEGTTGALVGQQSFSTGELWCLETTLKAAAEGDPPVEEGAEPPLVHLWSKKEIGGEVLVNYGGLLTSASADTTNGTFPWSASDALVLSGGVTEGASSDRCRILYCQLGDEQPVWTEMFQPLWEWPSARMLHAMRLHQPPALDGVTQPAVLVTVGGHCCSPLDGEEWRGLGGSLSDEYDHPGCWKLAEDSTIERSNRDSVYEIFRRPDPPSVAEFEGLDYNVLDRDDKHLCSWLHWAAHSGSAPIAELLLNKHSADPLCKDRYGQTALHVACAAGQRSTGVALVLANSLTQLTSFEMRDHFGSQTVLHAAARGGDAAVVRVLCERGVTVNATRDDACTALHIACFWGRHQVVKVLLESGADRWLKNKAGNSALQEVCRGTMMNTEAKNIIQNTFKSIYAV